jgi:hypothetical protein
MTSQPSQTSGEVVPFALDWHGVDVVGGELAIGKVEVHVHGRRVGTAFVGSADPMPDGGVRLQGMAVESLVAGLRALDDWSSVRMWKVSE